MNVQFAVLAEIQVPLAATNAEFWQLSERHGELDNKLGPSNLQHVGSATLSHDLKSIAGACERSAKRANMTRSCRTVLATPSAAALSTLLTERDNLKSRSEALTLETGVFPG